MKRYIKTSFKDDIFAMANLYPKRTGLPVIIWVDNLGSARNVEHNLPRVKVQNILGDKAVDDTFEVSISLDPKILSGTCKLNRKTKQIVFDYIREHFDDFMEHWNQEIDEDDLKERLYVK